MIKNSLEKLELSEIQKIIEDPVTDSETLKLIMEELLFRERRYEGYLLSETKRFLGIVNNRLDLHELEKKLPNDLLKLDDEKKNLIKSVLKSLIDELNQTKHQCDILNKKLTIDYGDRVFLINGDRELEIKILDEDDMSLKIIEDNYLELPKSDKISRSLYSLQVGEEISFNDKDVWTIIRIDKCRYKIIHK